MSDKLAKEKPVVHEDEKLAAFVRDLALKDYKPPSGLSFASQVKYGWLREAGSLLWIDTGDASAAEKVWAYETQALTTNNALVDQVVQTGVMDGLIALAAREIRKVSPHISEQEMVYEIGFLVNAKLALSLVEKFGAHVSVELHPDMAFNQAGTLAFARRYYQINPEHFYIKVPFTKDGLPAARVLSRENIPVNLTIGFSARQNYLAARFSNPSFVNVFLGRLNSLVEENSLGKPENVGEKAALASDEMMKNLRSSGAAKTNQIAASIRSGQQVADLAGMDVLTIPPQHAAEYLAMDISRDDIQYKDWRDLDVNLQANGPVEPRDFDALWQIDEKFVSFVDDVMKKADTIETGDELKELADQHEVKLFHDWTSEEREKIRNQGKIPKTSDWPGIALDTLMNMAALEFFAHDQIEVDERIRSLIS
ncbi:transaldolase family protein [bacterium]|nr:transaldolase family protein [bacterium]